MPAPIIISIEDGGRVRLIYSDELAGLLGEGAAVIRRASHVEPRQYCCHERHETPCPLPCDACPEECGSGHEVSMWTADMGPSGGPVLGPFALRAEALAAEYQWIERNVIAGQGPAEGKA